MCQECLEDLTAQKLPAPLRAQRAESLPCSKHGHPAWMSARLRAWLDFYNIVAPYCPSQTTLDHALISKICADYGIQFTVAFERLTWVLKAVAKRENKRARQNNKTHEGTQQGL